MQSVAGTTIASEPGVFTPGYYVPAPLGLSYIERHRAATVVHSVLRLRALSPKGAGT